MNAVVIRAPGMKQSGTHAREGSLRAIGTLISVLRGTVQLKRTDRLLLVPKEGPGARRS